MTREVEPTEQLIDVPGGRIYVKQWSGAASKESCPVVLLHESLGCVDIWKEFPRLLCERTGRTIIAYDRLGFGRSTRRTDLPSSRVVNEEGEVHLPAVLDALGIEQCSLFGHSIGGEIAIVCAAHLAERCESVISESAQAFVEDRTRQALLRAKVDYQDPGKLRRLTRYHGEKANWVLSAWLDVWLSEAMAQWSLAPELPKVRCPILAIHGDRDEFGSLRFPRMIRELSGGPTEVQIIPDCGHVPHREKRALILQLAEEFLAE